MSDKKKRTYQAETPSASLRTGLGLPPLKMVLVHPEGERANATARPPSGPLRRKSKEDEQIEEVVLRIIEHLEKSQ